MRKYRIMPINFYKGQITYSIEYKDFIFWWHLVGELNLEIAEKEVERLKKQEEN